MQHRVISAPVQYVFSSKKFLYIQTLVLRKRERGREGEKEIKYVRRVSARSFLRFDSLCAYLYSQFRFVPKRESQVERVCIFRRDAEDGYGKRIAWQNRSRRWGQPVAESQKCGSRDPRPCEKSLRDRLRYRKATRPNFSYLKRPKNK